jgi:lysophosphatidic acid acyltransferase/lysophosphatidylinositol acyltransferase
MYVQRIPMSEVPEDEEAAAKFIQDLFVQKDSLQDSFHTHGDFFKGSGVHPLEPIVFQPRISSFVNTLFWIIVTCVPIIYFLTKLLLSGNFLYLSMAIGIIFACKFHRISHQMPSFKIH